MEKDAIVVFRNFIEISLVKPEWEACLSCEEIAEKESPQGTLLSREAFDAREEKCSCCLDEPDKRVVMLIDDKAGKRFHVLIPRTYFEDLEPLEFLALVKEAARSLGLDYSEVEPKLFIPDDPPKQEIPEELMNLFVR